MKNLSQHIENQFFRVLNKEISIQDFEKWVYETEELEQVLSSDNYLDLIAFNYYQNRVFDALYNLLIELINFPKFETYRIIYLLDLVIEKNDLWKKAVNTLYHEYINSYYFLNVFAAIDDEIDCHDNTNLIDGVFIFSKDYAIQMKHWLISEIIIIKGREGHRKGTNYIDNRTEDEK